MVVLKWLNLAGCFPRVIESDVVVDMRGFANSVGGIDVRSHSCEEKSSLKKDCLWKR